MSCRLLAVVATIIRGVMKDNNAGTKILAYLAQQNRPYSAGDIFNNLHKEIGKTAVVRTLEELAQQGKINEKVYGKQKVYMVVQSDQAELSNEQLAELDGEIEREQVELQRLEAACRSKESVLHSLNTALTTEEAEHELSKVSKECSEMEERLKAIKEGANHVSPEEKEKICKEHETMRKSCRKRKRMAMDVINAILESYPKSKRQLMEEIGVETDEDCGVTLPL